MITHGKWIWLADGLTTENERACFAQRFRIDGCDLTAGQPVLLRITAVTKYEVLLNGKPVGRGPGRNVRGRCFCDSYDITPLLLSSENYLAVEVWNYGWSTYQSQADEGGLLFEILCGDTVIAASGTETRALRNPGFITYAPKRNVNLGFAEYFDGRKFSQRWREDAGITESWPSVGPARSYVYSERVLPRVLTCGAAETGEPAEPKERELTPLPVRSCHTQMVYPKQIVRLEDVEKGGQVFTVNTRRAFFGDRRDADETNFNAFLGGIIVSGSEQKGRISFPNRTWNGLIGSFRLGETVYEITDAARDVEVRLEKGDNFFLMFLHGKYDDLYSHIELRFPQDICMKKCGAGDRGNFFVVGPVMEITALQDGFHTIHPDISMIGEEEKQLFACSSAEALAETAGRLGYEVKWTAPEDVMEDAYLLSLARLAVPRADYAIRDRHLGILWSNDETTVIDPPAAGDYRRLIADFGDIYVGYLTISVKAPAGTILDIYGFENMYRGEIDHTIGINNGVRYICREGWQSYTVMAKMGLRYAMISVRSCGGRSVELRTLALQHETYASAGSGSFACNRDRLNRIWQMCRQTMEDSKADTYADSPTYEQAYWLGDSQVSAAVDAFLSGDYGFIRHNLLFGATAADMTPLGNALTPTDWITPIPMWTMNWMVMLAQYIEVSGDSGILDAIYGELRERLRYYRKLITPEGGFLVRSWNLIDWAKLDVSNDCVSTAYQGILSWCYRKAAEFASRMENKAPGEEAGKSYAADRREFLDTSEILRKYLLDRLWDSEREAFRDGWSPKRDLAETYSIQTHTLLLLYGILDDEPYRKQRVSEYVLHRPDDFLDVGSPFMLYYLYEAWARLGRQREMFEDIEKRWGEMIRYESTTCWEVFPGFYENSRTRSYCHAWSTVPAMLMQKYLLGVRREESGWKSISFRLPDTELRWCRGGIPTPFGSIYVDWNKDIKKLLLRIPEEIQICGKADIPEDFELTVQTMRGDG
ncbi:family 78 glycoside hydrolase catalytic domain [Lachnoclostridium sp. Marseille-P6806]|uniref:family 78 glycoside hydrolase catalytic domain n=1 Tax=Lachnoclostridium sp. Marseille-P6806 TaxID=2364793 RepID=UPI00102FDE83|nr:family 78 glycoside hydrolase catalytic domain [Lachnoclostridium sp. Marseille-P6806]